MKAVILAGGFGTRISEESTIKPKPMVEIGGKPILWHIMKTYYEYGVRDFIIACGYRSSVIKDYFRNYSLYESDVTFNLAEHTHKVHKNGVEDWNVTLVETGIHATKSERLLKIREYLDDEPFLLTYGDGVSNVDIGKLIAFHKSQKALVTLTAVQPPGRFGGFFLKEGQTKVEQFREKPQGDGAWINGGYFVVEQAALSAIVDPKQDWENEPMELLAREGNLAAYRHEGFWHPMDTLRDKNALEAMWQSGNAPWKIW